MYTNSIGVPPPEKDNNTESISSLLDSNSVKISHLFNNVTLLYQIGRRVGILYPPTQPTTEQKDPTTIQELLQKQNQALTQLWNDLETFIKQFDQNL